MFRCLPGLALPFFLVAVPVQAANDDHAFLCDSLAANPYDANAVAEGVMFAELDADAALLHCRRAAAAQPAEPRFSYQLARVLDKKRATKEANNRYWDLAEAGYPAAQHAIGMQNLAGAGMRQNVDAAYRWVSKAGQAGHVPAWPVLLVMHLEGLGTDRDMSAVATLAVRLANRADGPSLLRDWTDALLHNPDYENPDLDLAELLRTLEAEAEQGDGDAQFAVARMYLAGLGTRPDFERAAYWSEVASHQPDVRAIMDLSQMLRHGIGIAQDIERADRLEASVTAPPLWFPVATAVVAVMLFAALGWFLLYRIPAKLFRRRE